MKVQLRQWQLGVGLVFIAVVSIGLLVSGIPGFEAVLAETGKIMAWLAKALLAILLGLVMFVGPCLLGILWKNLVNKLDEVVEGNKYFSNSLMFGLALLFAVLCGLLWLVVWPAILTIPTPLVDIFKSAGWSGRYENPPIAWGLMAFVLFLIGVYLKDFFGWI